MNRRWVNQGLNSFFEDTQGPRPPDLFPQDKLKTRAYINPQIVNCELIKKSISKGALPSGNKIHVNPNFRGNGFSSLQKNSSQVQPVHLNLSYSQEIYNVQASINLEGKTNKNGFQEAAVIKSSSRFKKINNTSGNKSAYNWSKDNSGLNKGTWSFNCEKAESYILPHSSYKYTALKKMPATISHVSKTSTSSKKSAPIFKSKTKIINKSKTKLVNNLPHKIKQSPKQSKIHSPIKKQTKFVYSKYKKSPMVKVASLVRNKYKYIKEAGLLKQSKYKIDKRKKLPETSKKKSSLKRIPDIRNLFPKTFNYKINSHYGGSVSRNIHSWRRDEKIGERKINHFPNRRVVKIGGILYKSTTNKLTLASKGDEPTTSKKVVTTKTKVRKNHIVYVRGEKFILDKNGKTLKRQTVKNIEKNKSSAPKRIDIGGVTYIQKSRNVLVRTNVHQARNLVNKAKHKSIALLTSLHKRSTMPCIIFCKFGTCTRHNEGLCMYKHDPKNVAICKKFLRGNCDDKNCLLSHEVIQEKMATCRYFLNGFCTRENCPYLHVKLNENAAICENFLRGFCQSGKNCTKRHLYQCPEFDKFGICSQGTKCHYPHKPKDKTSTGNETESEKDQTQPVQYYVKSLRPFATQKPKNTKRSLLKSKDNQPKKEGKKTKRSKRKSSQSAGSSDQTDTIECVPKRVKLDKLPCFIPLKTDS